jgi:hypothetical protein
MARGPCTFKAQDMTRALVAAKKAGIEIARIKIKKDGTIEMDTKAEPEQATDLDNWMAKHHAD